MTTIMETINAANSSAAAIRPKVGGFPYLAEVLRQAGVTNYFFDVPSMTVVYATPEGDVLKPGRFIRRDETLVPPFDASALVAALQTDQRGESTFPEFVEASFLAGVLRFEVDTAARTCTYLGAHGEQYIEEYAAVELPAPIA
jgi:uncharacterized protein YbcV (DUF1398 family)